jgi:D-aspartate ligase
MTGTRSPRRHTHPAIVIGLDCITGLQTARILASRGVPVVGIASDPRHFACRTRVCQKILYADTATVAAIEALEALGPRLAAPAVLFPCTDPAVLAVSRARDRLASWYRVLQPAPEVIELLIDKVSFTQFAQARGLPIPRTEFLSTRAEAEAATRSMRFPCILKPQRKTREWDLRGLAKAYRVMSRDELLRLHDELSPWTDRLVVQEWIAGKDSELFSCNCYFDSDSNPMVTFVARKLRQWPPHAGVSSLGEECRNDLVLDETVRLFESVAFQGLGYVEMKRDARDGRYFVIEPNVGRPTGRSPIAEAGGVELLYTAYCDALDLPLPAEREQRYTGAKWMYLRRDLQAAAHYVRTGELGPRECIRSWRGVRTDAVFAWRDPLPFFADVLQASNTGARRVIARAHAHAGMAGAAGRTPEPGTAGR